MSIIQIPRFMLLNNTNSVSVLWFVLLGAVLIPVAYCYKYKRVRLPVMFAFSCFLAFNICMATAGLESRSASWGYAVLMGLGLAVAVTALVTAGQLSAPPDLM